jgi:hypothetical protein
MDDDARTRFFDFVQSEHFDVIYIHAYGLVSAHSTALADFIVRAGDTQVELLVGDPGWALTANHGQVLDFVEDAIAFTRAAGSAGRPAGLHFDVEPYLLDEWKSDQQGTMTQYLDLLVAVGDKLAEAQVSLLFSADIPFWYDTLAATYDGQTKALHQHVQDIVDYVAIMDYRDTAGGGDGIIAHAQDELHYAEEINKLVTVGVETNCIEPAKITFCEEGKAALEQELDEARLSFETSSAFHGFAVHDYVGYADLLQRTPVSAPSPTPEKESTATLPPTLTPPSLLACPTADAEGTVPPAIAIYAITFVVDGVEQVVDDVNPLQALPGAQVQVKEVTICSEPFEGDGGNVYVEFDPVNHNGQVTASEVMSTRAVRVIPGFINVSGPSVSWTISDWRHVSVVTVHYPSGGSTHNLSCERGTCEVDDRVIVPLQ